MAIKQDLYWDIGATWGADIACYDGAGEEVDLTQPGTEFLFWLGTPNGKILSMTLSSGQVTVDPEVPHVARIDIASVQQAAAGIGQVERKYRYEGWLSEPSGAESKQAYGAAYAAASLAKKYP